MSLLPDWSFFGNASTVAVTVGNRRYRYAPAIDCYLIMCSNGQCKYTIEHKVRTVFTHCDRNVNQQLEYVPPYILDGDTEKTDLTDIHKRRPWLDGNPLFCRHHSLDAKEKGIEHRRSRRTSIPTYKRNIIYPRCAYPMCKNCAVTGICSHSVCDEHRDYVPPIIKGVKVCSVDICDKVSKVHISTGVNLCIRHANLWTFGRVKIEGYIGKELTSGPIRFYKTWLVSELFLAAIGEHIRKITEGVSVSRGVMRQQLMEDGLINGLGYLSMESSKKADNETIDNTTPVRKSLVLEPVTCDTTGSESITTSGDSYESQSWESDRRTTSIDVKMSEDAMILDEVYGGLWSSISSEMELSMLMECISSPE